MSARSLALAGTISGGGGGVFSIKGSSPVSALGCAPVDERAPKDVLGWADDVGDRSSGNGDAVSTSDDEGSATGTLDRSSGRAGVGGGPSRIAAGDLRPPASIGCELGSATRNVKKIV